MLHVFGDSWGYGAELKPNEKPFGYYLSLMLNTDFSNSAKQGSSLGHILHTIFKNINQIKNDDYVVVTIPPDVRWYEIDDNYMAKSINLEDRKYQELIEHYNIPWFVYHHNLFIYNIITTITQKTNKLILAHSYGKLITIDLFKDLIDTRYFLSSSSLTKLLTDEEWENNYNLEIDGPQGDVFKGKYFEGNINHPNLLGHKEIARLLNDKFNTK